MDQVKPLLFPLTLATVVIAPSRSSAAKESTDQEPLTPGVQTVQHWVAWHPDAAQRARVVWQAVDEITIGTQKNTVMRWVKVDSTTWTSGKNVWDSTTQSWVDYVRQ